MSGIDSVLLVAFGGPTAPAEIRPFLEIVARGRRIPPQRLEDVARHYEALQGGRSPLNELTPRERDVLREMAEGRNNAAIAESLFLTERSVEKVIHSIFLKLDLTYETAVHRRVKAVILYLAESG